jgi:hypothetical protein
MAASGGRAWAGWIAFAGTMMALVGMINIFQGVVALVWDERVLVTADRFILVDVTSWGWTLLLSGVLLVVTSLALLRGLTWARITSIVVVGLHAVSQVAWLGATPVWSLLMIALDTVVLFGLTARWADARPELGAFDSRGGMTEGLPGDRLSGDIAGERSYRRPPA